MFLIVFLAALGLAPGVYTAVRLQGRHGWVRAALAGIGVTIVGAGLLLSTLVVFTPLGTFAAAACLLLALRAYDNGRLVTAGAWTGLAVLFASFAGWPR